MKQSKYLVMLGCLGLACSTTPETGNVGAQRSDSEALATVAQAVTEATAADGANSIQPIVNEFAVPGKAKGLVVNAAVISRHADKFKFQNRNVVPRLKFATSSSPVFPERLKKVATKFFPSLAASPSTVDEGTGFVKLNLAKDSGVAYTVPESGSYTMFKPPAKLAQTVLKDSSEAVATALSAIADGDFVPLAANESIDVVAVQSQFAGQMGEGVAPTQMKIGYHVLFGRSYAGIPVMGPPVEVSLDSEGKVTHFRKGWRDIAGEDSIVSLVDDATIQSRRDPLMVAYLPEKNSTCGYSEDIDPAAVQENPGVGCRFLHENANTSDSLNKIVEDWVNLAADPAALPLRGIKRADSARMR